MFFFFIDASKRLFFVILIVYFFSFTVCCKGSNNDSSIALNHLENGKKVSALWYFNKILTKNPNDYLALYGKGVLLIENHITDFIGFSLLEQSLEGLSEVDYRKRALLLTLEYVTQKKIFEQVDSIVQKITEEGFIDLSVYQILMDSYIQQKSYKKAIKLLEEGLEKYKISVLEENIAYIYLKYLKYYKKSYELYELLYKKESNPKYLYFLMNISYIRKHYKTSLGHLKELKEKKNSWFEEKNLSLLEKKIESRTYIPKL